MVLKALKVCSQCTLYSVACYLLYTHKYSFNEILTYTKFMQYTGNAVIQIEQWDQKQNVTAYLRTQC